MIKEQSIDTSDLKLRRIGAEKLVYLPLLLTGNKVAEYFAENNYPCLYRVHENDRKTNRKINGMIKTFSTTYREDEYQKLLYLLDGIYPKGWYDISGRHKGLKLDHYCHCTSGLRRAADIVVEHGLEVCYDRIPTEIELERLDLDVKEKALQINSRTKPTEWFANECNRQLVKRRGRQ